MADAFNCFGSWLLGSWLQPDRDVTVCLCDFGAEKAESPDPFFDVLRFDWPKTQRHVGLIHSLDILFSG